MKFSKSRKYLILVIFISVLFPATSKAYSVFAHLAIIDASWKPSLVPLIKEKYPNATEEDLRVAHSYAYGGSLMPDLGYFPFGSVYFTNLAHYVRTGDFITNLISQSKNIDEYAFALGALSHYLTDEYGHSLATNVAEPIVYPTIGKKFGKLVTYEQAPIYHSRMEFGFDVLQMARGNYASQEYHDFIGFNVSKPLLQRAFLITYGLDIDDVFNGKLDLTIATFRWSVRSLLPGLTRTAWSIKKDEIMKANPAMNSRKFHARIKRKEYFHDYGRERERPNLRTRITAFIIKILPKVGPLKALKFTTPGLQGEKLFIKSFDTVLVCYRHDLQKLQQNEGLDLQDINFDTGMPTKPGEYAIADQTYSEILIQLQDKKFQKLTIPLRENILSYYNKPDTTTKSNEHKEYKIDWQKTYLALQQIKTAKTMPVDSLKFPADTSGAKIVAGTVK